MLSTMDVSRNILISGPLFQLVDSDIFGPLEPPDIVGSNIYLCAFPRVWLLVNGTVFWLLRIIIE
jgi:hypothetical protein